MQTWDQRFESLLRAALRDLPDDRPLTADLDTRAAGLTSLAAVNLLLNIEAAYGISIPEELLTFESFNTPEALWSLVSRLADQAPGIDIAYRERTHADDLHLGPMVDG
ncbi:phosphopantetheine-binding protein [Nonomuraea spiralis]|uniref:phosphopantetheine-binding protein n=1 Tax=Nonomuraea TaxID=83681 RepID=UPI000F7A1669|nr:phosphopantetheine-binding protein [Nonomuraea sp. WAC 01424]RSN09166.1 phosphopantetheine-binding protein [Nonomuraea sp. WAC 01424]